MNLLAAEILQLEENARYDEEDVFPVVKLFKKGLGTWLLTELTGDIAYGLCDCNMGYPELGFVSITELHALGVEKDRFFEPNKLISQYAAEARARGGI